MPVGHRRSTGRQCAAASLVARTPNAARVHLAHGETTARCNEDTTAQPAQRVPAYQVTTVWLARGFAVTPGGHRRRHTAATALLHSWAPVQRQRAGPWCSCASASRASVPCRDQMRGVARTEDAVLAKAGLAHATRGHRSIGRRTCHLQLQCRCNCRLSATSEKPVLFAPSSAFRQLSGSRSITATARAAPLANTVVTPQVQPRYLAATF